MTDEAKALAERLRWSNWYYEDAGENTSYTSEAPLEAADLIETQAREIERLRAALKELVEEYVRNVDCTRLGGFYLDPETEDCIIDARAALAGDSHDQ